MNMDWILDCLPEYEVLIEYDNIEISNNKQEIHGLKERSHTKCMFCETPFEKWEKKDVAHAVSECVGNKRLINFCECFDCNHIFGEIAENHLGKFIMPYRIINRVYGKGSYKNIVKDMPVDKDISYKTYRYEQKKNAPIFQSEIFDVRNMLIERSGTGRCIFTENGFKLTIPRQNYTPQLVYASLLKIAYTLLPGEELEHYRKSILSLYLCLAKEPRYCGIPLKESINESEKQNYIDHLPNAGIEIRVADSDVPDGVNVCLLKRNTKFPTEPQILFALQMKWYTIVIPVLSDECLPLDKYQCHFIENDYITVRKLDFSKIEAEFICDMTAKRLDIPKELYGKLEEELRNSGLLRKPHE